MAERDQGQGSLTLSVIIDQAKEDHYQRIVDYFYRLYCFFQKERSKIYHQLVEALYQDTRSFKFSDWHRLVAYQFSNQPLSSKGSTISEIGGRFNIGAIDPLKYPIFPALYIAEDYETVYRERYQIQPNGQYNGLTAQELSLNTSSTDIRVIGHLDNVLDLTKEDSLRTFFKAIRHITLPDDLKQEAKNLGVPIPTHVSTLKELQASILDENWRDWPMRVDVPSNSQVLGHLAKVAGIEAVLYPSVRTGKSESKRCLAIFPECFDNSPSWVKLQDKSPDSVDVKVLNQETCKYLE
jgi:hypothetical protein